MQASEQVWQDGQPRPGDTLGAGCCVLGARSWKVKLEARSWELGEVRDEPAATDPRSGCPGTASGPSTPRPRESSGPGSRHSRTSSSSAPPRRRLRRRRPGCKACLSSPSSGDQPGVGFEHETRPPPPRAGQVAGSAADWQQRGWRRVADSPRALPLLSLPYGDGRSPPRAAATDKTITLSR